MSSATSIKRPQSAPVVVDPNPDLARGQEDAGFRAWHFFVLASLIAATVAVMLSRGSTPEHLIFISLAMGAAGAAAAALHRMLAPLTAADPAVFSETLSVRTRAALEREKLLTLRALKDLEFDRAMGKLSPRDFDEMAARLRARAISLMKELDEERGYRAIIAKELEARLAGAAHGPASSRSHAAVADPETDIEVPARPIALDAACSACGTTNDGDATFCKRCGRRLLPGDGE
jgi:hypothetical protein